MPSLFWKRLGVLVIVTVLASVAMPAPLIAESASSWPYTAEGLTPAKEWVFGRLDNGLRYVVRKNALPAGNVSLRFCVQVGTAHETPGERGLAHFVEHMAFNGTTHFPGETLVQELRKHGVDIGPELSAFTFLTHTIYNLDAPSIAPDALDRWFTVLRDFADGMQFDPREVKRERGVIASELRDRESPDWRADVARRNFLYPRSPLSNDLRGSVNRVDQKQLRAFYHKWYHPDRMIVVAVGDADPAQLEMLVHKHFASLQPRTPASPKFDPALKFDPAKTTFFHRDRRVSNLSMGLTSVLPRTPDSFEERRRWTARNLAMFILNNRLRQVMREFPARFGSLEASSGYPTPFSTEISISFAANTWEWYVGTTTLEQELRRS
ncbi:MAG TPA: pitrilysin family protein, partial [Opitutus sp.]|nr:pitrilysin family protein [Opitutus sp.]